MTEPPRHHPGIPTFGFIMKPGLPALGFRHLGLLLLPGPHEQL